MWMMVSRRRSWHSVCDTQFLLTSRTVKTILFRNHFLVWFITFISLEYAPVLYFGSVRSVIQFLGYDIVNGLERITIKCSTWRIPCHNYLPCHTLSTFTWVCYNLSVRRAWTERVAHRIDQWKREVLFGECPTCFLLLIWCSMVVYWQQSNFICPRLHTLDRSKAPQKLRVDCQHLDNWKQTTCSL